MTTNVKTSDVPAGMKKIYGKQTAIISAVFTGAVATAPIRRDDRWFFSLWNEELRKGIDCVSSVQFETKYTDSAPPCEVRDVVQVDGAVRFNGIQCAFDTLIILEQAPKATGQ